MNEQETRLVANASRASCTCRLLATRTIQGNAFAKASDTINALQLQVSELKAEIKQLRYKVRNQLQIEEFNTQVHTNLQKVVDSASNSR